MIKVVLALFCHFLLLSSFGSISSAEPSINMSQILNTIKGVIHDEDKWINVLNQTTLPSKATIFFSNCEDEPLLRCIFELATNRSIVQYHIVPHALSFYHLKQFEVGTRFPTLLSNKSILLTSNTESNFTIDGSPISHPDLWYDGVIAIHVVPNLLDYTLYGGNFNVLLKPPFNATHSADMSNSSNNGVTVPVPVPSSHSSNTCVSVPVPAPVSSSHGSNTSAPLPSCHPPRHRKESPISQSDASPLLFKFPVALLAIYTIFIAG